MHLIEEEILEYMFLMLREGGIEDVIEGMLLITDRDANAETEDCVIRMISGLDGDTQQGGITVNVYVKNVPAYGQNGYLIENNKRTRPIALKLNEIVHDCHLMNKYGFRQSPTTIVSTFPLESANAHFHLVNVQFDFSRYAFGRNL